MGRTDSDALSTFSVDSFRLDGRIAMVTGGGSGIGRGYCHALGGAGAAIAVVDIDGSGEHGRRLLADAGVDVFHASTRRFDDFEFEDSDLNLAGWAKTITGRPSITVGSVGLSLDFLGSAGGQASHKTSLDPLVRRLERSEFDLVAVGRALLSDPAWAHKLQEGRENEIVAFDSTCLRRFE